MNSKEWYEKGIELQKEGNSNEAVKAFDKALELDQKDAIIYVARGVAFLNLENHKQAIDDFTKALELDEKIAEAYYNRGFVYFNLGEHKQAITDFKAAAKMGLDPAIEYLMSMGIPW